MHKKSQNKLFDLHINKVQFVNPVEVGPGNGEGVVLGRRGSMLIVDTGLDIIEVPVKLVFDGTIPSPGRKVTSVSRATRWLASNLYLIIFGVIAVFGIFAAYFGVLQLLIKLLPDPELLYNAVKINQALAGILAMVGVYKLYQEGLTGRSDSDGSMIPYLVGAAMLLAMSVLIEKFLT